MALRRWRSDDGERKVRPLSIEPSMVASATSLSEATIQKLVREGKLPKPRALSGRRAAWLARDVEEWLESRPVSDMLPPESAGKVSKEEVV